MYETDSNYSNSNDAWVDWLLSLFRAGTAALDNADRNTGLLDKPSGLVSLYRHYTHSGLTGEQWEQNAFNARQAELAYNRQLDLFNMTQSIPAQVEQAKQAGINPASLYGNLSAGSVPSVSSASGSGLSSADLLSLVTNFVMKGKELSIQKYLAEREGELKESETERNRAESENLRSRTRGQDIANDIADATKTANVEMINQALEKLKIEVGSADYQKQILAHGVSQAYFQSLITEIQYLYDNSSYFDRLNLAHYSAMYQKALSEGETVRAQNMQRLLNAEISQMYADATLKSDQAEQVKHFIVQYFTESPGKKSLFTQMTEAEIGNLIQNTEFSKQNGEFVLSEKARVDKQTSMAWLEYVNSFGDLAVPIITGAIVAGPAGAAVGAAAGYVIRPPRRAPGGTSHSVPKYSPY